MFKKTIFTLSILIVFSLISVFFASCNQSKHIYRNPTILMEKYYRLKKNKPELAQQLLNIILAQNPHYTPALQERQQSNKPSKARHVTDEAHWSLILHLAGLSSVSTVTTYLSQKIDDIKPITHQPKTPKLKSCDVLKKPKHPNHIQLLIEAGYLAIRQHQPCKAIDYFSKAYAKTKQPQLAMQLGYLYETIQDKSKACHYFKLATQSHDKALVLRAENARTNLAGFQTKKLPTPYFSEAFFSPFSQSRFGLTVRPFVARLGIEQSNAWQGKEYVFIRRTQDNKSKNLGQLSQIFEDNVQITGVGAQIKPLPPLALIGFLEVGAAYDLVYRNRDRWRGDLRTGLMYYDQFGKRPAFFDHLKVMGGYYSDLYAEATYFTRYNNNVIAGVKTHQGIRLFAYHDSMFNGYITGRMLGDTRREFFNNFAELGPGVEFIPSNRLNIKILYEYVRGVYLPAGAIQNPYEQYYKNSLVQLLLYVKL